MFHDLPTAFWFSGAFLFSPPVKAVSLVTSLYHALAMTVPMSGAKQREDRKEKHKGFAPSLGNTAPLTGEECSLHLSFRTCQPRCHR